MSCNIDQEQLRSYALDLFNGKDADEVAMHVQSCAACQNKLSDMERTVTVLAEAFDGNPPDWLMQKTIARIRERRTRQFTWGIWGIPVVAGFVITLLIVLLQPHVGLENRQYRDVPLARSDDYGKNQLMQKDRQIQSPSLFDVLSDDMDSDLIDPIRDRSIYESLDIVPEIASLLL